MEQQQRSSYRQVFKATSLFGGVQVFNILIGIIRSKFIAVLLGPGGMGIAGLFTSTTGMITSLTGFGLASSAVRDVAEASASNDRQRVAIVVTTLRKLVWLTGLLGAFVTLVLAPWLSKWTFGSSDYTYSFLFLSMTLLISQLGAGQNVILQGTRRLKYLAKSNLLGALLGLITTVPLYYSLGEKGIVPALIIASVMSLLLSWYFARKIPVEKMYLSFREVLREGKNMLTLGFMLSLSGLASLAASYLIRIYVARKGGVEQVGLYNAGFAIIGTYVGLLFTAMGTDYFPRLSGVAHNNQLAKETINQQAEIAILVLAPILMVFFVFIKWVIYLLYSGEFTPVNGMIQWAALGMFFKTASWAVAFLFLAKGASRVFFINELVAHIYSLCFNVVGYKLYGLDGLGISFLITYVIYLLQVVVICNRKYRFQFNREFVTIFMFQLCCAIFCFCVVRFFDTPYQYFVGMLLIIISTVYSLWGLDRRLELKSIINKMRNRK